VTLHSDAAPRPRQWILLVCLFLLSLPAVTTRIYSSDEIQYFAFLRSLWFDHDLSFEDEYRYFYDHGVARSEGFHETFLELTTETGRRINFGTIGCALLWSPFYAAGDAVAHVTHAPIDGYSKPYVAAVAYGSAVYGFLAVVLAILCAAELELKAVGAAIAVWLGTPLLFYMYVAPPFSHACSAFAVALFTYTWLRARRTWSVTAVAALGAAGALMFMVREQDLFFAAGPAVDFILTLVNDERQTTNVKEVLARVFAAAVAFAVVFTPQAIAYERINGHLGPSKLVIRKMYWSAPHALQVLFSPAHGFFWWTPLALVAIAGLCWLALPPKGGSHNHAVASGFSRKRQIGIALIVMVALQIYVGGSVDSWTVAGGFGQRRFVALTTALVIGVSALGSSMNRVVIRALIVMCVYWNLALIAEFATGLMDRQRLEPRKNAYDAFVALPREAPSLAYRYLFDRSSFYRTNPAP
jgi:hypothetical protein